MKKPHMQHLPMIFLLCWLATGSDVHAQETPQPSVAPDSLKAFTQKVSQAYAKASYLSFRVKYLYANAGRPADYLDSAFGTVQMGRGSSRVVIDSTEMVFTSRYAIRVLRDDKLIYLSAPARVETQNPVGMLDSIFAHMSGLGARLYRQKGEDVLLLDFPAGGPYTRMEITVDDKTGFFRSIAYTVNAVGLVGRDMIESPDHPGPYESSGRVYVLFSDYQNGHFDDRLFSEDNFFTRVAGKFTPSDRFKDYRIFLASSNL